MNTEIQQFDTKDYRSIILNRFWTYKNLENGGLCPFRILYRKILYSSLHNIYYTKFNAKVIWNRNNQILPERTQ